MTTPRPSSGTWFRKIVLIDPLDSDIQCCRASLRIAHDEKNQVQSISLAFKTKFRETKAASGHSVCRPLSVYLTFPSKIIKKRELHQRSNDKLCPSNIREKLNSSGNTPASSVITMQLELSNFGTVAYPSGLWESMRLADMKDEGFAAFAKICRSESLRLHLMYRQLNVDNLHILSGFFSPKGAISMQDESFDHARHGYLEGDWKNLTPSTNLGLALPQHFPPPDYNQSIFKQVGNDSLPPAYSEDYLRVGNKRSRGPRKTSPCGDKRRRVSSSIPPIVSDPLTEILGSPTEVNTPSVCSLRPTELFESLTEANTPSVCSPLPGETDTSSCYSPSPHSIRPTDFNPASSLGRRKWGQLHPFVKKLQTESDTLKREVLALSGRSCSPTRPQDIDCEHGVEFESGGNDDRLDSAIGQALRAYIDSAIRRKVEHFVNDAKRKIEQYFEKAMETLLEESSDRMYDLIQEAGGDLRDQADDCMVEIRDTTTEGLEELKEEIQKQTQAMDDYATERLDMIDDHASRITRPERFLCARRNSI